MKKTCTQASSLVLCSVVGSRARPKTSSSVGRIQVIASNAMFQLLVPSRYLGRVVSLWFLAAGVAALAALPLGIIGDEIGLRGAFGGAGAIYIVIASWFGIIRPKLFPRKTQPEAEAASVADPDE